MNDPAIDAAQRVIVGRVSSAHPDDLTAAAREALKPIRELHKPHCDGPRFGTWCKTCRAEWPCPTAKLIYSTEELA